MALITCPECQQQVSDRADACPKCGFPISILHKQPDIQREEAASPASRSIPVKRRTNKKPLVIAIIAVVCVVALVLIGVFAKKAADERAAAEAQAAAEKAAQEARTKYLSNLNAFLVKSIAGAAEAEALCNLTKQVWYDTIYEEYNSDTAPYTRTNGYFNEDFNTSLRALYSADETLETVDSIEYNQVEIKVLYKALQNPTEEFETCYEIVDDLYSVYFNFTNLAISPSGSLTTYSETFSEYDSEFLQLYNKLELLIPEE